MLAEIGQNVVAQALRRLAVALHRLQALQVALAQKVGLLVVHLGKILFVQQKFVDDDVLRRKKQHALRRQPVTPGTARLLVIILHALGHVVVQHEPHVGLVNAHAKGVRRHNDRRGVVDEVILIFAACFGGQARVVLCGRKAVFGQKLLQLVHILAGGAVDDAALAGVVAQILDDKIVLAAGALDLKVEVGPVKAGHKHLRVVEPQRADNVVLDLPRGRGRERRHDRAAGQTVDEVEDL